jgi:alpha-amylase
VVAVNNAEQAEAAAVPTYMRDTSFRLVYGSGPEQLRSDAGKRLGLAVGPLSAVVYRASEPLERSRRAPSVTPADPGPLRDFSPPS